MDLPAYSSRSTSPCSFLLQGESAVLFHSFFFFFLLEGGGCLFILALARSVSRLAVDAGVCGSSSSLKNNLWDPQGPAALENRRTPARYRTARPSNLL